MVKIDMKLDLFDLDNQRKGEVGLNASIFGQAVRADIMHRVVMWQASKMRAGTHSTKEIAAVQGSTRKIYRQKGTGRARHGSLRAPQFRGGAVIFGPHPRDHSFCLNKKVRRLGLISALSLKRQEGSIIILDSLKAAGCKSAAMLKKLRALSAEAALIVDVVIDKELFRSVSNLPKIDVLPVVGLNVLDLLRHERLVLTVDALREIEGRLL